MTLVQFQNRETESTTDPPRILVAGIGGASLGTEIVKCLKRAGRYAVFGCDISEFAYGHYQDGIVRSFIVPREKYVESVLSLCEANRVRAVIPGGEEPLARLMEAAAIFRGKGIHIAANHPDVIAICSDKERLFERLRMLKLAAPWTSTVHKPEEFDNLQDVPFPCIIKPCTGTGGSQFVFLASDHNEAMLYVHHILRSRRAALIQEYLPLDDGEFTVGVLSLPDKRVVGSVAMRRIFHNRLSISAQTKAGLVSSGYSQGVIDYFPEVRAQAERMAALLGSTGPMNIQGRLRNGLLIPFEINPRFSASTYLRAMAGFEEIDLYLCHVLFGERVAPDTLRPGYYLRSFSEVYVAQEGLRK